jgi:uncharacterized membrane protein YeaQ/YmgE (transglycosylase-associated protein family)
MRGVGMLPWIVLGLMAGVIGRLFMPERQPGGFVLTIIIGIVGAIIGGYTGSLVGFGGISDFDFRSFVVAIAGATLLLLLCYKAIKPHAS